jgi:2-polyprenyl-6-hydroxyphenyl methylase/3-demethylubiquinone-9 3-methyltransferase
MPIDCPAETDRFAFGNNWLSFAELVDDGRVERATASLTAALGVAGLTGRSFLDVGCGSGLFSLAAHRLGARVHSFDYDPDSVAACAGLREKFGRSADWTVGRGDILDDSFTTALGVYDVVYSWGVLHHTGDMWRAIETAAKLVAPGGTLFISIYNDQGPASRLWWQVKQRYVRSGPAAKRAMVLAGGAYFGARRLAGKLVRRAGGQATETGPRVRGMSARHDLVDWIGGFPFEVAKPEQVFGFLARRGFTLTFLKTCGGSLGCNEFVFSHGSGAAVSGAAST